MQNRVLLSALILFSLVLPVVFGANVTINLVGPNGSPLANSTVKIIGINYTGTFTTNANGSLSVNLTAGENYLVIGYGDDFRILGLLINVSDNETVTLNASKYNVTSVNVSPSELMINGTVYYNEYPNLSAEIAFPMKLYLQPNGNFTLEFPQEITKGVYTYKLKDIILGNSTLTSNSVTVDSAAQNDVTVEYTKSINTTFALVLLGILGLLLVLLIKSGSKAASAHMINNKIKYARKRY